jgi:hypothetical protein
LRQIDYFFGNKYPIYNQNTLLKPAKYRKIGATFLFWFIGGKKDTAQPKNVTC